MISIVCKSGVSFFYATRPRSGVVCDLLNPRLMLPRALYFASLFLVLLGRSIADEVNPSISPTADHPLKVKVVVVAMFEVGADTGDVPGEFQFWIERRKLAHVISLPSAYHDVRTDGNGLEAAFVVGNRVASELFDHWDQYSVQIPAQIPSRHRVRSPTNYYDPL